MFNHQSIFDTVLSPFRSIIFTENPSILKRLLQPRVGIGIPKDFNNEEINIYPPKKKTLSFCLSVSLKFSNNEPQCVIEVLRGSAVKFMTFSHEASGSSCTGSSGFFVEVSLTKTLQNPSLVLVKHRKYINMSAVTVTRLK